MKRRNFLSNSLVVGGSALFSLTAFGKNNHNKDDQDKTTENLIADKKATAIQVSVPSTIGLNETFRVGIRILTEPYFTKWIPQWNRTRATVDGPFNQSPRGTHYMDNVLPTWDGVVNIFGTSGYQGPSSYSFSEGAGPYENDKRPVRRLEGFSFSTPGIKYIRVIDPVSGLEGISNPIHVDAVALPNERLFWGDLHCHSIFGDGVRSPEEIYAFARDESFLDIFALTDHTEALSDGQWNYFRDVTNTFNEAGKFVAFVGGEWTSKEFGHHNFIYPGNDGPIIRSSDSNQNTLSKLYAIARNHKALVIANHPAEVGWGFDWEKGHDPEVERLVEVYSIGGGYEIPPGPGNSFPSRQVKKPSYGNFVVDGLKKGYRLGMIGVGDTHDGRPGDALHELQKTPGYKDILKPGLMGVWAKDLTRESVFNALWNRRVYGTTNNRTWLKFSINDHPMGSEITVDKKMTIKIEAASNLVIQRIDLICNGKTVQFLEPRQLEASWNPKEKAIPNGAWYYVRITLDDDHLAWSSPIWVNM
ncbi:CehA/McbA family metallohydrolase [Chitinophaga sp. MM2321]|uniref:CehA/McbA family metallohydrolase n=1 Tax=Chitinophaga sp. MM2321 TaxID=3137178 RepID=UPI0032D5AFDD